MSTKFYHCKRCSRLFQTKDEYRQHRSVHSNENENNLSSTDDATSNASLSTTSTENKTTDNNKPETKEIPPAKNNALLLKTEIDNATVHIPLLTPEIYEQGETPFTCIFCEKVCKDIRARERHELTHIKPFQCNLCTKDFSEDYKLRSHLADDHYKRPDFYALMPKGSTYPTNLPAKRKSSIKSNASSSPAKRRNETSTYDTERQQNRTSIMSPPTPTTIESIQDSSALMSPVSMSTSSDTSSTCSTTLNYTDEQIKEKTSDQIKLVYNPTKMTSCYKCQICSEYFTKAITAVEHFEETHSKLRKYKCLKCPLTDFKLERELIRHLAAIHQEYI